MSRQPPKIEDISHRSMRPTLGMTGISETANWLFFCCLLSAGHCFSAALINRAELKLKSRLCQACFLAWLSLSVLCLTGTHLFKVAAVTYYAPPVGNLCCLQLLLPALQKPAGPLSAPLQPLHLNNIFFCAQLGTGQYVSRRHSSQQGGPDSASP